MLTRNYDSLMTGFMTILPASGYTPTEADWLGGMPGAVKIHTGEVKPIYRYPFNDYTIFGNESAFDNYSKLQNSNSSSGTMPFLLVGGNNATETYNDYHLDILENLTVVGYRSAGIAHSSDGCVYTTVKTFINNTENDITVNELGIYAHCSSNNYVLLYRKKLDKPVTLKAKGGSASFSLDIDIPYANKP